MENLIVSERLRQKYANAMTVYLKKGKYVCRFSEDPEKLLDYGNFFDLRKGEISYCPKGKVQTFTESGKWVRKDRQTLKPGKFFIRLNIFSAVIEPSKTDDGTEFIVPDEALKNRMIELITGKVNAERTDRNIRISGRISEVYETQHADEEESGNVANSCMRSNSGYKCHRFAGFYDRLPGVKIMYALNENDRLIARALLWRTDDKKFFLDRIYANDTVYAKFEAIAEERGWMTRDFPTCSDIPELKYSSNINLRERIEQDGCPYMDSMTKLHGDRTLKSYGNGDTLQNCDGYPFGNRYTCDNCDCDLDEGDQYVDANGNTYCSDCYHDMYYTCQHCDCEMTHDDAMRDTDGNAYCERCYSQLFYTCNECGEAVSHGDEIEINGEYYCDGCADGVTVTCEICGERFDYGDRHEESDDTTFYCTEHTEEEIHEYVN